MLNVLTTPENNKFVFVIPENAKIDKKGFYIIDKEFKELNKHQDFEYLAHDLEYRGLNVENTFFDNIDVMNKKTISYSDYLLQFIDIAGMKSALISYFGIDTLVNSKDDYLNDIPLKKWGMFNSKPYIKYNYRYAAATSYQGRDKLWADNRLLWSQSTNVSFAKQVGYIIRAENSNYIQNSERLKTLHNNKSK